RIADQHHRVMDEPSPRRAAEQVRVPAPSPRNRSRHLVPGRQKRGEFAGLLRQCVSVDAPEADIEEILLSETPAIAAEIAAEVELGGFGVDGEGIRTRRIDLELGFLSGDDQSPIGTTIQLSADRTEMAAGANEHRRTNVLADDPASAITTDARNR